MPVKRDIPSVKFSTVSSSNIFNNTIVISVLVQQCRYFRYSIKLQVLTVAILVAINANEIVVAPTVASGGVCIWQESDGRFCVGSFGRNLASVFMKCFHI